MHADIQNKKKGNPRRIVIIKNATTTKLPGNSYLVSNADLVWSRRKFLKVLSGFFGFVFVSLCCYELSLTMAAFYSSNYLKPDITSVFTVESGIEFVNEYLSNVNATNTSNLVSRPLPLGLPLVSEIAGAQNSTLCQSRIAYYKDIFIQNNSSLVGREFMCGNSTSYTLGSGWSDRELNFFFWPFLLSPWLIENDPYTILEKNITTTDQPDSIRLMTFFKYENMIFGEEVEIFFSPYFSISLDTRFVYTVLKDDILYSIISVGVIDILFLLFSSSSRISIFSFVLLDLILLLTYVLRWYFLTQVASDLNTSSPSLLSLIELGDFCTQLVKYIVCVYCMRFFEFFYSIKNFGNFIFIFLIIFIASGYIGYTALSDSGLTGEFSTYVWLQFQMVSSQWPEYDWWDPARHSRPVMFTIWQFMNGGLIFCVLFNFFQAMVIPLQELANVEEKKTKEMQQPSDAIVERRRKRVKTMQQPSDVNFFFKDSDLRQICLEAVSEHLK